MVQKKTVGTKSTRVDSESRCTSFPLCNLQFCKKSFFEKLFDALPRSHPVSVDTYLYKHVSQYVTYLVSILHFCINLIFAASSVANYLVYIYIYMYICIYIYIYVYIWICARGSPGAKTL